MKKFFALMVFLMMLCSVATAETVASGACGKDLTWTLDDEGTLTISGSGDMYDYSEYSEYSPWQSYINSIEKAVIDDCVTSIGSRAFYHCSSLTSITIPDSVTSIGTLAFTNCSSLTSITIPDSVTIIFIGAFYECSSLTSITIPDSVTSIAREMFRYCNNLTSITIPKSVTSIGYSAFSNCTSLSHVYYGGTEKTRDNIEISTENTCLTSATWHYNSPVGTLDNGLTWALRDGVMTISGSGKMEDFEATSGHITQAPWQSYRTYITEVVIEDGVRSVGANAFSGCTNVEKITIGRYVESIGKSAFYNCTKVNSITFLSFGANDNPVVDSTTSNTPDTDDIRLKSIGDFAFYYCSSVTSIVLPDGLTTIGNSAFAYCTNLDTVSVPDSVVSIGWDVFVRAQANVGEAVGVKVVCSCNSYARKWCDENDCNTDLQHGQWIDYDIPVTCTTAGLTGGIKCDTCGDIQKEATVVTGKPTGHHLTDGTCVGCGKTFEPTSMSVLMLPASLTAIQAKAFSGVGAEAVVIPEKCETVSPDAFGDGANLRYVFIPSDLEDSIGDIFDETLEKVFY